MAAAPVTAEPMTGLPPLVGTSRYEKEVDLEKYPEAPAPEVPPLLRWDLSGRQAWAYDYQQDSVTESHLELPAMGPAGTKDQPEQAVRAQGTLTLRAQGNATATMSLNVRITVARPGQAPQRVTPEPLTVDGVQEDGTMRGDDPSTRGSMMRLLFPLPTRPLKVGESETAPKSFPVEVMSQKLTARGVSRLTLDGYVRIGKRTCARLSTSLDVLRLDVPADVKGSFRYISRARAIYYFDVNERVFVSGRVSALTSTRGTGPPPEAQAKWPAAQRRPTFRLSTDNDTLLTVRLDAGKTRAANKPPKR